MSYNPYSLEGKTILVTGASSGIGKATAIECSKMGATVIITARNKDRLDETFLELEGGQPHQQFIADLSDEKEIDNLVLSLPVLDGCVNNAGINKLMLVQFIKEEELKRILQINTVAPIILTQKLVKSKKLKKLSSVVFTSSVAGNFTASFGNSIYSTSKAAINGFVRNAALELAAKKIRCNTVNPGMINTKLIKGLTLSDEQLKDDMERYPLKRYGEAHEVAHAIIYLLSDASTWVTGISLVVDGGITIR